MRTIIVALSLVTLACALRIPLVPSGYPEAPSSRHSARSVEFECPIITPVCVGQGGDCTFNFSSGIYPLCEEGQCTSNVCPTVPGLNAACTVDDCSSGLTCHPVTKVCVIAIQVKPPGASCSSDNQCLYSVFGASDVRSSCVSGSCFGVALGGSCSGSNQCVGRAYCSSGTCTALQGIGASCTSSAYTVAAGICNDGTVIPVFSVGAGATCTTTDACGAGHYCNSSFTASGICLTATAGGNICATNDDCANGGTCTCYGSSINTTCPTITGNDNADITVITGLANCIDAQSCGVEDFSCITSKCKSQYCSYRNYVINSHNSDTSCLVQYLKNAVSQYIVPPIDCSNAAVQQVASFALIASMILAVMLL